MQDELGSHILDVKDTLYKIRLTSNGEIIHEELGKNDPHYFRSEKEYENLVNSVASGEQCRLEGHLEANKVPGNFHISHHARPDLVAKLA
jgi:hypothetical protein